MERAYLCIDLKSFYASVECVERGLDAMTTNLVVADSERTDKTICLAITPPMKALGIRNRCRLFEIPDNIPYITAPPRMQLYIHYAASIYGIYLKYISKDDIHVYSIDEAFMDVTQYLQMYQMSPKELGQTIIEDIYKTIGIRAACGIGTNLYLAKVALDITAKHASDFIGELNEKSYCSRLWNHKPLTDFWRIGPGIAKRLAAYGIYTMGEIAKTDEEFLYTLFGKDAELLIDHAWGKEPVTIADIKAYKPASNCLSSSQVLTRDYNVTEGELIVREMMDLLCLDLVDKQLVTSSVTLHMGYAYHLQQPPAHGTVRLPADTNSDKIIIPAVTALYNKIVDLHAPLRRIQITCNQVIPEEAHQYNFFQMPDDFEKQKAIQKTILDIKKRFGKNTILKGMNLEDAGTTRQRNNQIGGHRSG